MEDPQRTGDDPDLAAVLARIDAGETLRIAELAPLFPPERDRFAGHTLGIEWDTLHRDRVVAHLDVDERHQQPFGIVHGGVWCGVVETLASFGALLRVASQGQMVVGVHNSTDFLRPVRGGRVHAVATPVHAGRLQQLWVVELNREDGREVARGQVRLHNLDPAQLGGG